MQTEPYKPGSDPQSGDVTDGSVDYYPFEWEPLVTYDEAEMEPVLYNCDSVCSGNGNGNGNGNGGVPCGDNLPVQTDEEAYDIIDV